MTSIPNPNRRDFAGALATGAAAFGIASLLPRASPTLGQATTEPADPFFTTAIDVGPKADFSTDGPNSTWIDEHHFIVVRENKTLYALSSKCTHRNCDLTDDSGHLICPCHGSTFSYDGKVTVAPAKKPLPRFAIFLAPNGHVMIDDSQEFPTPESWKDPKSFISLT